ncbi:MAG: imidazole glycerol phosphate synthase subunit HisH [Gemmatimonadales bacterium]
MIVVVDYGVNNLKSVIRALAAGGHVASLSADPEVVRRAERVLMPGVGNFGQAVPNLEHSGLGAAVQEVARAGRPVMGICLGLQLFFATSEEAPGVAGLGLLPGHVQRFRTTLHVPHVGWASVQATAAGSIHPMLRGLFEDGPQFYYHVHSYHPAGLPEGAVLATGDYDGSFATIVGQANIIGAQFHPEKSQRAGIELLSRFVAWHP